MWEKIIFFSNRFSSFQSALIFYFVKHSSTWTQFHLNRQRGTHAILLDRDQGSHFFLVFALRNCAYERRLTEEVALVSSLKDCTSTNGGMRENTIKRFVTESRQQKQSWIIYFFCNVAATITCLFSFKIVRRSRSLMWSECWCLSIGKELLAVLHVVDFLWDKNK